MKRSLLRTREGWLLEIRLAIKDARETEPFSKLFGQPITDADLFHLAPLVCLKFREKKVCARRTKSPLGNRPRGVGYFGNRRPEPDLVS